MNYKLIIIILIIILICVVIYLSRDRIENFTNKTIIKLTNKIESINTNEIIKEKVDSIFVSIASYRDKKCVYTLKDLFLTAKNPEKINVGICQQNKLKSEDCKLVEECIKEGLCIRDQIKIINMDYKEAKGPAYARYLCSTLYNNEDYYLQIDSHMNFINNWDEKLIMMYNKINKNNDDKKVISTYPLDYKDRNKKGVPYICESMYNKYKNIPEFQSYIQEASDEPKLTYIVACGFLFMSRRAVLDVPFDPYLPYLFMGEEVLLASRLWTSGYDIYSPNINIVYHDYERKDEPKVWDDNKEFSKNNEEVIKKVRYLLGVGDINDVSLELLVDIDKYGMGNKRSLEEYLEFGDLDLVNGKGSKKWCE